MEKGNLFARFKKTQCVQCQKVIKISQTVMVMDVRSFTESGLMEFVSKKDRHWYWVFCSLACQKAYIDQHDDEFFRSFEPG